MSSAPSGIPDRAEDQFATQVRGMFDRIAGVYDLMNSAMTVGLHHRWRERTADRTGLRPGDSALDVCCGTGDLALELSRRVGPDGNVIGCDFSERMLELAGTKGGAAASPIAFEWADALELPYEDGRFDAVTVGFGVRNLADLDQGLAEMAPGPAPGRPARDPRDHQPPAPAALDLLLDLVRSPRPAPGHDRRRPRGVHATCLIP